MSCKSWLDCRLQSKRELRRGCNESVLLQLWLFVSMSQGLACTNALTLSRHPLTAVQLFVAFNLPQTHFLQAKGQLL